MGEIFTATLNQMLFMFLLIFVGFILQKLKVVPEESAKVFDDTIQALSEEYCTGLTSIKVGNKKEFFGVTTFATVNHQNSVGMKELTLNPFKTGELDKMTERIKELSQKGYSIDIKEGLEEQYIATHEFAHTLIDFSGNYKNYVGMDVKLQKKIKREVEAVFDVYKEKVQVLEKDFKNKEMAFLEKSFDFNVELEELNKIQADAVEAKKAYEATRISKYSLKNSDEFMAEAFTDVKLGKNPSEYSKQVVEIIDKYFKN